MDIFKDIIPSLMTTKNYCLDDDKEYVPRVINKAISLHEDCIFIAAQMNLYKELPNKAQYDYYFFTIKQRRRSFIPWIKFEKDKNLELVMKYFDCNEKKAKEALSIINKEQLKMIRKAIEGD